MTWKTLAEALNGATAKGFDIGEAGSAIPAVSQEEFGEPTDHEWTAGPCRAVTNSQMGAAINDEPSPVIDRPVLRNGKRGRTQDLTSEPPLGVRPRLLLIMGSRRAGGGGRSPALRRSPRERARELGLVLHQATPS